MSGNWTVRTQSGPNTVQNQSVGTGRITEAHGQRTLDRERPELEPFVSRNVDHENGRTAKGHFDRVRHVELAWFHDRGNRGDLLLASRTAFANRVNHRIHFRFFDANEDRGVGLAEKATDGFDARGPEATVGELREQSVRIFGLHHGYDKLHDVNPSRAAITRQISSDNESAGCSPSSPLPTT